MMLKYLNKILNFLQFRMTYIQNRLLNNYEIYLKIEGKGKIIRDKYYYSMAKDIYLYSIKYPEKIIQLKSNLDSESKDLIDRILERVDYIYTHNLIERKKLLTDNEISEFGIVKKYMEEFKKREKVKLNHIDMAVFYYQHGLIYVPTNIINFLKNKDFIDGGAYNGDSALMFERFYQPNLIYSFEPHSQNLELLKKAIKLNNLKKVIPVKLALGNKKERVKITNDGMTSAVDMDGDIEIESTTIDSYVKDKNLNVGLIKLDIEGYSLKALEGARETIKKFKPILLISIYHNGEEFFEIKNYIEELNQNYCFIIRKFGPQRAFFDTNLIAWSDDLLKNS